MLQTSHYDFNSKNVDNAPSEHGVYELLDSNKNTIYIGRAAGKGVTIRSRLQSHLAGYEGSCTQSASFYRREEREDSEAAEAAYLREFKRTNGSLPRCNEVLPTGR